jgi:glycosyltransferase involved in cell wall biosynthesis
VADGRLRVFLAGGDGIGWAIDEDRRQTQLGMEGLVRWVARPEEADAVHAVWWEPMCELPRGALDGKAVVCHMDDSTPMHLGKPHFQRALARATHWVTQNRATFGQMRCVVGGAADVAYVPYGVDLDRYQGPDEAPAPLVAEALAQLPKGAYVVGSFQRDTLGEPLQRGELLPKLKKGPDVFVEVLAELRRRGEPVVALLSGPRRHWVRRELERRGVPYVFAGVGMEGDDNAAMIEGLTAGQLALLYRRCDLYLTTSRAEGGPRGVLEAAACGTPQLSTACGLAPDLLSAECIYRDAIEAVEKIQSDLRHGTLRRWAAVHLETVRANYTFRANRPRWEGLYRRVAAWLERGGAEGTRRRREAAKDVVSVRDRPRRICLWHEFVPPPWGGGNQFMLALKGEAERQGIEVSINGEGNGEGSGPPATAHLIQSVWFDAEKVRAIAKRDGARVVHRVDGPLSLIRRTKEALDLDRKCYEINNQLAAATVVQSWAMLRATRELGFAPVRPVLVSNACDPGIFYPPGAGRPAAGASVTGDEGRGGGWGRGRGGARLGTPERPLRVIATSWSDNPGKGGAVYEWIDRNLDHSRFKFTFAGRLATPLKHGEFVEALPSRELAELLRGHDVYLTASRGDPCSNALVEALNCGLPAIYFDSGGHPELAQLGGLPFSHPEEIPALLERMAEHLGVYRRLIVTESIREVCGRYLQLLLGERTYG